MASWARPMSAVGRGIWDSERLPRVEPPGNIRAIGIVLPGNVMLIAELLQQCSGKRVCCIAKGPLVLDDDAAVETGTVHRIGGLGGIGVHGVGVVGGDHEAPADKTMVFFGVEAEGKADALQHVPQETGIGALAAAASDLFVVEDAVNGDAVLRLRL